ncbi:DUF996 domain-containing protein [Thermococcus sp. AM4]|uniref:DUF996 domain-containing protein n=1 Tax=Thermococcus sp. (strain AM4) TaxID=246969 RepID=UPI00064EFEEA|nr:DUF996 domain-containing protein [Thermococcus sp. AM4]
MVNVRTEKMLGVSGFSLMLLTRIAPPGMDLLLYIAGVIVLLMALRDIGNKLDDGRPFRYGLIGFVGLFVLAIVFAVALLFTGYLDEFLADVPPDVSWGAIVAMFLGMFSLIALHSYFLMKSFSAMHEITGVGEFGWAARLFKWGAVLIFVIVGAFLILLGYVFALVGFAKMPDEIEKVEKGSPENHLEDGLSPGFQLVYAPDDL